MGLLLLPLLLFLKPAFDLVTLILPSSARVHSGQAAGGVLVQLDSDGNSQVSLGCFELIQLDKVAAIFAMPYVISFLK